jgi:quercetin dioxygenase-like cupin family protein
VDLEKALPERIRTLPSVKGTPPIASDGRAMVEHGIKGPDYVIIYSAAPRGLELPWHSHETENVTVIVKGETVVTTDEGERHCRAGDWYHSDPGQRHRLRYAEDTVQIELQLAGKSAPTQAASEIRA